MSFPTHPFYYCVCQYRCRPFLDKKSFRILIHKREQILIRLHPEVIPDQDFHLVQGIPLQLLTKLYNFFVVKSSFMPTAACNAEFSATMRPGLSLNSINSASPVG